MTSITGVLKQDAEKLKNLLPAEDILTFDFQNGEGLSFQCIFADAVTDKELLADEVLRPLQTYSGKPTTA